MGRERRAGCNHNTGAFLLHAEVCRKSFMGERRADSSRRTGRLPDIIDGNHADTGVCRHDSFDISTMEKKHAVLGTRSDFLPAVCDSRSVLHLCYPMRKRAICRSFLI